VTGASGYVANHFLFMLASGDVFGKDQPLHLMLLGREGSYATLEGVAMVMAWLFDALAMVCNFNHHN
jgi:hypothetical protein